MKALTWTSPGRRRPLWSGLTLAVLAWALVACQSPLGVSTPTVSTPSSSLRTLISGVTKIEAEAYSTMLGVIPEATTDTGGGQDVGSIDAGDWMVYPITINTAGSYKISYRVASPNTGKSLSSDINAGATQLGSVAIPNTGSWQTWTTVTQTATLPAGTYNFGVNAGTGGWNLNWLTIEPASAATKVEAEGYSVMAGVITEATSDTGGGLNIGSIDAGDYMVYPINVATAGNYTLTFRVSSIYAGKSLSLDLNAGATLLGTVAIPNTGGWQTWTTVSTTVNLPAGASNFGINAGTGGWNLNWFTYQYAGTSGGGGGSTGLIPLASGKQMTFQFKNNTNGAYADSQIYVLVIARNSSGVFSYIDKNGNLIPCVAGQNASAYSIKLSDFTGYQFPSYLDSGRLYVSYGKALSIPINSDINGNVGVAFPNIENPADANINTYFDWVEFAVLNNQIWCNTTQVDQFGFPMTMELFTGTSTSYTSSAKVGITESRAAIYSAWNSTVPAEFKHLATTYRILAPLHSAAFRAGGAYGTYFDGYINQMWTQYTNSNFVLTIPQGTFTGRVGSDGKLALTKPGDATVYKIAKPTGEAVWGGLGALATGNSIELAIEAQICAAFHRHVMGNTSTWNTPSQYYLTGPADYFSQFWHQHSLGARAYGFCYDDVNDQSSTMTVTSPRGIVLGLGF